MEPSDPKNKNFRMELSELQKFHSQKKMSYISGNGTFYPQH